MKNSINHFYSKIERHIDLVAAYTGIQELPFIIKSCRLKPYKLLFEDRNNKLEVFNVWCDEFGNTLEINKNKEIKISFNKLQINRNKIISTDLYEGLNIDKIYKFSKILYLFDGKDEDLNKECAMIGLLGIDHFLRCHMYLHDEWSLISPLYLGLQNIKTISNNLNCKYFIEINNNFPIPCSSGEAWISSVPVHDDLVALLNQRNSLIISNMFQERKM